MPHNLVDYFQVAHGEREIAPAIKPLWSINTNNKKELMLWLTEAFEGTLRSARTRSNQQIRNLAKYRGIHYWSQDKHCNFLDGQGRVEKDTRKLMSGDNYEIVEQLVSKLTRFKPTTVPIPATNEHSDKVGAKVVKNVLETIGYVNDKDAILTELARRCFIFGEQPILTLWDKDKGEPSERWMKAKDKGLKKGKVKVKGEEFNFDPMRPEYIGDVCYKLPLPWEILYDPQVRPEECEWIIYWHHEHIEKVKKDYPGVNITKTESVRVFDIEQMSSRDLTDHVVVMELFHRSNKYAPNGMYVKATPNEILEGPMDLPYNPQSSSKWGNLPIELLTNLDIPGQLHGESIFAIIDNLETTANKVLTMANRNLMLMGHPKFMVPRTADVNISSLGNDAGLIVDYSGPTPPQLVTAGTIHPELFQFYQLLVNRVQTLAGSHSISRGDPPPGIRAGIAIRLLEDIENQRVSGVIKKFNQLVVDLDKKTLGVVGKYYKENQERMINIVGRDKTYQIDSFDVSALSRPYDIRMQQSSSLPQTPAARTQTVIDLRQMFGPDLVPDEVWVDMLELATPEKFFDAKSAAVDSAEWENEQFVQGNTPPEPAEGQNHVVYWSINMKLYNSRGFAQLPKSIKEEFKDHVRAREFLMWLQAQDNPTFAEKLLMLPGFPAFFVMPQSAPAPATVQDNRGGARPNSGPQPAAQTVPSAQPSPEDTLQPTPPPSGSEVAAGA